MFYISNSDESKFIMAKGNARNLVNSMSKATKFKNRTDACNMLVSLPKRLRKTTMKVVEINSVVEEPALYVKSDATESESCVKINNITKIKGIDEISGALRMTSDSLQKIKLLKSSYCEQLSQHDKKIQAILHNLEDIKFSASQGYKILRELQILQEERRVIKNNLAIADLISDKSIKQISKVCDYIDKIPTMSYNPNK